MYHAVTLRLKVDPRGASEDNLAYITDALGECARSLEHDAAEGRLHGLVPDLDDPGRYAWEIVAEAYPYI